MQELKHTIRRTLFQHNIFLTSITKEEEKI
jgi:hypothetical protein